MIRTIDRFFLKALLFSCWFISTALYNIEALEWGLQVGWAIGLIYIPFRFMQLPFSGFRFCRKKFYPLVSIVFTVILCTVGAWSFLWLGYIELPDVDFFYRSFSHTVYIFFYLLVLLSVYSAIVCDSKNYWSYFSFLFLYPFCFIAIWGCYQFLSTYDFFEYAKVFNNNLSTGFTYDRFKDSHRVSSVFPEPSEYSYYLALMGPMIWASFRGSFPVVKSSFFRWSLLTLWISQALMVKSLSFAIALPVIAFACVRHVEGIYGFRAVLKMFSMGVVLCGVIYFVLFDRISEAAAGSDGSSLDRWVGFVEAIDLFYRSPVFGFGYGIIRGLDAISFSLACFGIVGSLTLWLAVFRFCKSVGDGVDPIAKGALLSMIIAAILSNNFFDHLFLWVLFAFLAASPRWRI